MGMPMCWILLSDVRYDPRSCMQRKDSYQYVRDWGRCTRWWQGPSMIGLIAMKDLAIWELRAICARQMAASRIRPSAIELPEPWHYLPFQMATSSLPYKSPIAPLSSIRQLSIDPSILHIDQSERPLPVSIISASSYMPSRFQALPSFPSP